MNFLNDIKEDEKILIIKGSDMTDALAEYKAKFTNLSYVSKEDISEQGDTAVVICCESFLKNVIPKIMKTLSPGGKLVITGVSDKQQTKFDIITGGFMNIEICEDSMIAAKPKFKSGSSAEIKLPKKSAPALWKLDDDDIGADETIDPDDLLDESDLQIPDPTSLRVCATTGKRKACKDCSCGLADELAAEGTNGKVIDTKDAPKSSCGSCYLGDAFRCASCPYLGMPAFKPGEKIQLLGNQLQADV